MTGGWWPSEDIELRGMLNLARNNTLVLFLLPCFFVLFFCVVLNVAWSSLEPLSAAVHTVSGCLHLFTAGKKRAC